MEMKGCKKKKMDSKENINETQGKWIEVMEKHG